MKKTILTALLVAATAAQARFTDRQELTEAAQNLQNNVIYDVSANRTITGAAGQAALSVPSGATSTSADNTTSGSPISERSVTNWKEPGPGAASTWVVKV